MNLRKGKGRNHKEPAFLELKNEEVNQSLNKATESR